MNDKFCPVCGFEMSDGPRSFNICPSCGTEFGLHDENASIEELRAWWVSTGPLWQSTVVPQPAVWDPMGQLMSGVFLNPPAGFTGSIAVTIDQQGIPIGVQHFALLKTKRRKTKRPFTLRRMGQRDYLGLAQGVA